MKRILKAFVLMSFIFILTGCGKSNLKEITYKEYEKLIENKETFVVEMMRTGCSHCQDIKPKLEEIANKYNIEIKYINVDKLSQEENDNISITGTPTLIFYNEGVESSVSTRIVGDKTKDYILNKFKANGFIKEEQ